MRKAALALALIAAGGMALGHAGVKDERVMAWMHGMKSIAQATRTVALMARGEEAFDAEALADAADVLEAEHLRIPALFEVPTQDPVSEALPAIWETWDDFEAKSERGLEAVQQVRAATTLGELQEALGALNQSCRACHQIYRE
ncbi:MAG: cytochrome c [Pseudomonadota bacterium]